MEPPTYVPRSPAWPLDTFVGRSVLTSKSAIRSAVAALGLVATLMASAVHGPDANWDLLNYHYYNGRALATGSILRDVAPAGLQTYLHPLIDVPIYFFVQMFGSWWGLVLWAGLLQWFCLIPVWRLTGTFAALRESAVRRALALTVVVMGSGAASLLFTTFGDWVVAALIAESLTRVLRSLGDEASLGSGFIGAGVCIGLALTVKLTSLTFAIAIAVGLIVTAGVAAALRLTIGAIASFAVFAGPWMAYLSSRYGSPVFPFYNRVFRSESAPRANFDDARYGATSASDVLTFPGNVLRGGSQYSELLLRDWRYAVLLLIVAAAAIRAPHASLDRWQHSRAVRFLVSFLVIGYLLWIVLFGYYRYFLPTEILTSILIVVAASATALSTDRLAVVAVAVLPLGFAYQDLPAWGRGDALRNDGLRTIVDDARPSPSHVILAGPPPLSYLAAEFPASTRFASLAGFASGELLDAGPLARNLRTFVRDGLRSNELYAVVDTGSASLPSPLENLTLVDCRGFESLKRPLELCRVVDPSSTS